jgi:hypothetical protein
MHHFSTLNPSQTSSKPYTLNPSQNAPLLNPKP